MSGYLDANVLLRYLTGEPPALAARARRIIDTVAGLVLTDLILAETEFVLMQTYGVRREQVVDHLTGLLRKANLTTAPRGKDRMIQALALCRPSGRVSFADAFLWATAGEHPPRVVYTFDERFPADGVEVRSTA